MVFPVDGTERISKGNRYNFDEPVTETSRPEWLLPERVRPSEAAAHNEKPDESLKRQQHVPAPMRKRAKNAPQKFRWPEGGLLALIAAFIIFISFGTAFDIASGGKIRALMFASADNAPAAKAAEPAKDVAAISPPTAKPAEPAAQAAPAVAADAQPKVPDAEAPKPAAAMAPAEPAPQVTPPSAATPSAVADEKPQAAPEPAKIEPAVAMAAQPTLQPAPPATEPALARADEEPAAQALPQVLPQVLPPPVKADDEQQSAAPAAAEATPAPQQTSIRDCSGCPELVAVPAGSIAGANAAKPLNLDHAFAIGRNDITFDDWERCVAAGACKAVAADGGWGRANRPQIFVSYDDVTTQYLPWLSRLTGKTYRLPTKDEWQFAALGGAGAAAGTSQGAMPDCFNASGAAAAGCSDEFNGSSPVGSFPANALGLFDMKGNVWMWAQDCWKPFTYAPDAAPNACDTRVVVGGAWSSPREALGALPTAWEKADKRTNTIGFRIARTLP